MSLTKIPIEDVRIADIKVGSRRRKKLGGLTSLQKSIEHRGLLHPIILRNGLELVAGARRLAACMALGWKTIPARHVERMSDEDLRAIELEENTERLGLLTYEMGKARLAEVRQKEAESRAEIAGTGPHGKPKTPGSKRDVAERAGMDRKTIRKLEAHVAIADRFPFMQTDAWTQRAVLKAGEILEQIPKKEHKSLAVLLDQPLVPPKMCLAIADNLAKMEPQAREKIYALARSDDPDEHNLAMTEAQKLPREPHRCVLVLRNVVRDIGKCRKQHTAEIVEMLEELIAKVKKEDEGA